MWESVAWPPNPESMPILQKSVRMELNSVGGQLRVDVKGLSASKTTKINPKIPRGQEFGRCSGG